jgi:hypothetical protein
MAQVSGITVETTYEGVPKTISFDYKKYGDLLLRFFKSEGIDLPYSPYNKQEVDNLLRIKSDMKNGKRKKVEMSNFWD